MYGNKSHKKHYRIGGTRGGQAQFKWDDVKADKYRENYLGNSLLAPVGRWQKGKDLTWYAKAGDQEREKALLEEEKQRLKDLDDDLLNQTLGITNAKKKWTSSAELDKEDLKQLLAKGNIERSDLDVERVNGLGKGMMKFHDHLERKTHIQKEIEKYRSQLNSSDNPSDKAIDTSEGDAEANDVKTRMIIPSGKSDSETTKISTNDPIMMMIMTEKAKMKAEEETTSNKQLTSSSMNTTTSSAEHRKEKGNEKNEEKKKKKRKKEKKSKSSHKSESSSSSDSDNDERDHKRRKKEKERTTDEGTGRRDNEHYRSRSRDRTRDLSRDRKARGRSRSRSRDNDRGHSRDRKRDHSRNRGTSDNRGNSRDTGRYRDFDNNR